MEASNLSKIVRPATRQHIPHELVSQILARLPIGVLQRFRRVCKAWHDTISDDPSFARAHLRHQRRNEPWLLITPEIDSKACDNRGRCTKYAGWYRWEKGQSDLVYAPDAPWFISKGELWHKFTHCDGLVLVPAETTVRMLNPATRRVLELPLSPCAVIPAELPVRLQTFGFGHDPRSNTYKVVRLFWRSLDVLTMSGSLGVEVFSIGTDKHWRDIVAQPPYPVIAGGTATSCKGFLFWIIDSQWVHKDDDTPTQGLVCFSLEGESFNVMSTPMRIDSTCVLLAELCGELCMARMGPDGQSLEMWMCGDFVGGVNPPSWYRRYTINVSMFPYQLDPCPLAAFHERGKFFECAFSHDLFRFDAQTWKCEDWVQIKDLRFQDPAKDKGTFIVESVFNFNVIPYIPSLVPI